MQSMTRNGGFTPNFPDCVAFVALSDADEGDQPPCAEEESLLGSRTAPGRRREFLLGRAAARQAVSMLGVGAGPILRGAHGEPQWPPSIVGSITHTEGRALAAAALRECCGGVGLDVEDRRRFFPELVDQVAFGFELTQLSAASPDRRVNETIELFSAKETVFKAFFPRVRRFFGFEGARLRRRPGQRSFQGRLVQPLDPAYPPSRTFEIDVCWNGDLVLTSLALPADGPGPPRLDVDGANAAEWSS